MRLVAAIVAAAEMVKSAWRGWERRRCLLVFKARQLEVPAGVN
jgi:hypothetical protein